MKNFRTMSMGKGMEQVPRKSQGVTFLGCGINFHVSQVTYT